MLYLIFFLGKTLGEKLWHLLEKRDKLDLWLSKNSLFCHIIAKGR